MKRLIIILAVLILAATTLTGCLGVVFDLFSDQGRTTASTTNAPSDEAVYELAWNGKTLDHQTIENFKTFIADSQIPVLVDFWAVWCGPCTASAPVIDQLAKSYAGKIHIIKVNTDYAGDIANDFNVTGIPHFVVIKDGKQIDSLTGYSEELETILGEKIDAALA
jgi:thioredoxin 1